MWLKGIAGFYLILAVLSVSKGQERQKRGLQFPYNSATGILVAIAIPLDLPRRNVFVSYNFEANYNMPTTADSVIPGPLTRLDLVDNPPGARGRLEEAEIVVSSDLETETTTISTNETSMEETEQAERTERETKLEGLLTRNKIYKFLIRKLNNEGVKGKTCLLRAICESATDHIYHQNGVLGDLFHIILTPSSSINEQIDPEFYKAEKSGKIGKCSQYTKNCHRNVLDYISEYV